MIAQGLLHGRCGIDSALLACQHRESLIHDFAKLNAGRTKVLTGPTTDAMVQVLAATLIKFELAQVGGINQRDTPARRLILCCGQRVSRAVLGAQATHDATVGELLELQGLSHSADCLI